jgi:hypothetical protein
MCVGSDDAVGVAVADDFEGRWLACRPRVSMVYNCCRFLSGNRPHGVGETPWAVWMVVA